VIVEQCQRKDNAKNKKSLALRQELKLKIIQKKNSANSQGF
jgi:hypothetical protein